MYEKKSGRDRRDMTIQEQRVAERLEALEQIKRTINRGVGDMRTLERLIENYHLSNTGAIDEVAVAELMLDRIEVMLRAQY